MARSETGEVDFCINLILKRVARRSAARRRIAAGERPPPCYSRKHIRGKLMPRMLAMPLVAKLLVAGALIMLVLAHASAQAQDYPTKTVRVIIPLGAGGGGDIFTRAM